MFREVLSGLPFPCRLLDVDAYSFDFKLMHIAKHVQLPAPPTLPSQAHLPREDRLPPLIVVNMQMPDYPVSVCYRSIPHSRFACATMCSILRNDCKFVGHASGNL